MREKTVGDAIDEFVHLYSRVDQEVRARLEAQAILEHFKWEQILEGIRIVDSQEVAIEDIKKLGSLLEPE